VSSARTFYCDAPGCDTHGSPEMPGWLVVSDRHGPRKHFCNGDCLMRWAAAWSEPPVVIPLDGESEKEQ
jgi:hypothetical protein